MRRMTVTLLVVALLVGGGEARAARRRSIRCCVMVPAPTEGETRPYCFVLNVRPARQARHVCRALGGRPGRPGAR